MKKLWMSAVAAGLVAAGFASPAAAQVTFCFDEDPKKGEATGTCSF